MTLPLNALRTFETVARLNSFSAAAEELCVTQSAVSHQIKKLEIWLGTKLFFRQGKTLNLLPEGVSLAKNLTPSLRSIEESCNQIRLENNALPLVVAAVPSIASLWLVPRLDEFRKQHPNIDIRIEYALHGRKINFNDVDFTFSYSKALPAESDGRSSKYLSGRSCPVCSPSLADMQGLDKLVPDSMLAAGLLHDTNEVFWREWFQKSKIKIPKFENSRLFHDFNLLRAAALSGQGIALCPEQIVHSDIQNGRLVQLSKISIGEDYNYYITRGNIRRSKNDKIANAFQEWALSLRNNFDQN